MKTIVTFLNPEEARVARSYLAANGIEAIIGGEESLSVMPHIGMGAKSYQLMVSERDEAEAQQLLDVVRSRGDHDTDDETASAAQQRWNKKQVFLVVALIASVLIILIGQGNAESWRFDPNRNARGLGDPNVAYGCLGCPFGIW